MSLIHLWFKGLRKWDQLCPGMESQRPSLAIAFGYGGLEIPNHSGVSRREMLFFFSFLQVKELTEHTLCLPGSGTQIPHPIVPSSSVPGHLNLMMLSGCPSSTIMPEFQAAGGQKVGTKTYLSLVFRTTPSSSSMPWPHPIAREA